MKETLEIVLINSRNVEKLFLRNCVISLNYKSSVGLVGGSSTFGPKIMCANPGRSNGFFFSKALSKSYEPNSIFNQIIFYI